MQSMHRTGTTYTRTRMHSSATYMRIGRAGMPLSHTTVPQRVKLRMDSICLPRVTSHDHLGATVNDKLSWDDHVSKLYTDCARRTDRHPMKAEKQAPLDCFPKDFYRRYSTKDIEYTCAVRSGVSTRKIAKLQDATYCRRKTPNPSSAPEEEVSISHPDTHF